MMHEQGHLFLLNDFFLSLDGTAPTSNPHVRQGSQQDVPPPNVVENAKPMRMACMICFVDDIKGMRSRRDASPTAVQSAMSVTWRNVRAELTRIWETRIRLEKYF